MFIPDYENKNGGYFTFGAKVSAEACFCLNNAVIKDFWKGFCRQSCELALTPCEDFIFKIGEAQKPTLCGADYAVNVEKTGIFIAGNGKKGLIDGFMTLLHQIEVKNITAESSVFEIACGEFKEKPHFEKRMVHFCIFPETDLWEIERFIKFCAALKYSHLVLEFWGMLRYDCLKELGWSFAFKKEQIRPLIKTANELGLEIIPMFNHWGHASASRAVSGKHVVLDQNPKLQPLFGADGWTWAIEKPEVCRLLKSVRTELIDLCGEGEYFHLGCDEAYNFEITEENYTVLTDYLNGISSDLASAGRRAIVWGDMLIARRDTFNPNNRYTVSCESIELEKKILCALDRSIIIADWQYSAKETPVETALIFKEAGFDTLLCPWDGTYGASSAAACVNTAVDYELFGVMHTTWNTLSRGMPYVCKVAFMSWSNCKENNLPPFTFFAVNAAKIMRCVFPSNGDYEKSGWTQKQISEFLR